MPAFLLPLALGAVSAGVGYYQRQQQQRALERELAKRPSYTPAQSVVDALGDAEASRYATDPAVIAAQQQAQVQAASQMGAIQRNATSGTQALGASSAVQSNYNAFVPSLAGLQSQFAQQNRAALMQARQMMAGEERMVQEDRQARNQERINIALGKQAANSQLVSDGLGLASSAAFSAQMPSLAGMGRAAAPGALPATAPSTAVGAGFGMVGPHMLENMPDDSYRMTPTYQMPVGVPPMMRPRSPFANQWWLGGAFGR